MPHRVFITVRGPQAHVDRTGVLPHDADTRLTGKVALFQHAPRYRPDLSARDPMPVLRRDVRVSSATSKRTWRRVRLVRSSNSRIRRISARNRFLSKRFPGCIFIFTLPDDHRMLGSVLRRPKVSGL